MKQFQTLANRGLWHINEAILKHLTMLNVLGCRLSVISTFITPGDTLLAGAVCRNIHDRFPKLKLNCVVRQPELLKHDPCISTLNEPPGFWRLTFDYLDILNNKDGKTNVLKPVMTKIGILNYEYRTKVWLTEEEKRWGAEQVRHFSRPIISVNVMSREMVKVWRLDYWKELVGLLQEKYDVMQLGDAKEPVFEGVLRLAGCTSLRQAMAVIGRAAVHIGPDSFLMHAANGLDVPSVIIYGGSRTPDNLAYEMNESLYMPMPCGPCWLHDTRGDVCPHDMECMKLIKPSQVLAAVERLLNRRTVDHKTAGSAH